MPGLRKISALRNLAGHFAALSFLVILGEELLAALAALLTPGQGADDRRQSELARVGDTRLPGRPLAVVANRRRQQRRASGASRGGLAGWSRYRERRQSPGRRAWDGTPDPHAHSFGRSQTSSG